MPEEDWVASIRSELEKNGAGSGDDSLLKVKKLRKIVLRSLDLEDSDKDGKKKFKKTLKAMEEEGVVAIDAEGTVTLQLQKQEKERKRKKESKKEKKTKKRKTEEADEEREDGGNNAQEEEVENNDEDVSQSLIDEDKASSRSKSNTAASSEKGVPCNGNPQGVTRLFLGNLPFAVDEATLSEFLPGITHIKWITDKETGKFYGSAFVEMDRPIDAAKAVARSGQQLMNRSIKANFAPARPGDVWPPANKVVSGGDTKGSGGGGQAGGRGIKAMGPKPDNCVKLFIGNLSYDIDDDTITKFFDNVGAEVKAVRWLSHKETGDFKGCGFVEFWKAEACDKAATLNGKALLGRPIRIDWTE